MPDKWVKIGIVGVDSGRLLLSDPGYQLMAEVKADAIFDKLEEEGWPMHRQLNFDKGHAGAGVVFNSGLGDGVYDVMALIGEVEGWGERVKSIRVDFVPHPVLGGD